MFYEIEMLTLRWEVCYEMLVKQIKTSFFPWLNFLEKDIYVNKGIIQIFDIFD